MNRRAVWSGMFGALALLASAAQAAEVPAEDSGERTYTLYCAGCHAASGRAPGTAMLGRTRGPDRAVLVERRDLTADTIKAVVRNGYLEMTPFRASEISDQDLDALARYITTRPAK